MIWAHRYGDPAEQSATSVAVDGAGDAIVTGLFDGTLDLGCNAALQSAGGADVFVAKIDPAGVCVWAKGFGDAKDQQGTAVAVDNSGAVYVAGSFQGTIDFAGTPPLQSSGAGDVFVAKLAPDGTPVWSRSFTNANQAQIKALAVDGAGNVVVTGSFSGALDFDGGPLQASASSIVVAKLDGDGNYLWSKVFGAGSGMSLVVDATGATFVTGFFKGTADFDGSMATSAGNTDIFVAKLDAGGTVAWSRTFGDPAPQDARGITLDPSGNVLITGLLFGSVSFGGPPVSGGTDGSIYAAKLDPSGGWRWSNSFGIGIGTAVATDASGNVVLTGGFNGGAPPNFGGGPLQGTGIGDIYLAKLDPMGGHQWSQGFGQAGSQSANGLALDAAGSAYLAGAFSGTLDFGGGPLVSATAPGVLGTNDVFLAKLSP